MSREIKFRVWNKQSEQYERMLSLNCVGGMPNSVSISQWGTKGFTGLRAPNFVLEQFTGLKDKNGEEIYEGDIVLDYYEGDDAFIVKWDKDTASFVLTGTDNIASVSFDNFYSDQDLEIIGNIHENPELLKGDEDE